MADNKEYNISHSSQELNEAKAPYSTPSTKPKPHPRPVLPSAIPKSCHHRSRQRLSPISQLVDIQWVIYCHAVNPKTKAGECASLARAWTDLEERKRIMRMKPAPKAVDVSKLPGRRKSQHQSSGPIGEAPAQPKPVEEPPKDPNAI